MEVAEKVQQLDEERRAVQRVWQQKDNYLRQKFSRRFFFNTRRLLRHTRGLLPLIFYLDVIHHVFFFNLVLF